MNVATTDKPGEVSIPIGQSLYRWSPLSRAFYVLWILAMNSGPVVFRHASFLTWFVLLFVPFLALYGLILCFIVPWVYGKVVVSAAGLEVRRFGRVAFAAPWETIAVIRVLQLYFWSTTSRLVIIGADGKVLGQLPGPATYTGAHVFYYLVSAFLPPSGRIVRLTSS